MGGSGRPPGPGALGTPMLRRDAPRQRDSFTGSEGVLAAVADLFFVARIRETARLTGVSLELARTPEHGEGGAPPRPPPPPPPPAAALFLPARLREPARPRGVSGGGARTPEQVEAAVARGPRFALLD